MKYALVVAMSMILLACQGNTQNKVELKTTQDSVSYAIGTNIGTNLKQQKVEVNVAALAAGIQHVVDSAQVMLTEEQAQQVMTAFQQRMMAKHQEEASAAGEKNRIDGEAFLAANKNKEGVKVTASGLQYKILKMGTGPKPKADQTVTVHYRGTLIDGTEFDSSYKRGEPATFGVGQVIGGWTEALQLMPEGSKWELYIPSNLAYGDRGAGPTIQAGATLIFEVELLSVK
ncbi:MAG: FKBP-type peptidyl-prolyl cis-trans isomerase [Bacteroidetes bacterium]|nr:FKBP-type peptidyl-prolyl cis-trans isomerase [Bacteroidota bacterium]MCW5894513.1 FKBP-type peptidyl-prolyl cis-trans isomerase [Bacteroidota bacterium]